jgi:hypothetical protein
MRLSACIVMVDHRLSNLMGNIRSGIADVAIHLPHDAHMFILFSSQQIYSLLLSLHTEFKRLYFSSRWPPGLIAAVAGLVGLETGIGEDDDQPLRVFIGRTGWEHAAQRPSCGSAGGGS